MIRKIGEVWCLLHASALLALIFVCVSAVHAASQEPLLLRDPTVSKSQIAFSYANTIWIANRDGSGLRRLTSGGHEGHPVFSPDGSQIAFAGNYDGSHAVYAVPAIGGEPRRLTFHPADLGSPWTPDLVGWTPDGKRVLFNSHRAARTGGLVPCPQQLFTVPIEGGFATPLPFDRAAQASFSADGARIAYVPITPVEPAWKRYRGGQTTPIWIANLADSSIQAKIPRENSNDTNPMWVGNTIYFLSDRTGPVTLFAYDTKSQQVKQIVKNGGMDIKSAFAASDVIVYEQFGSLHMLDLKSGQDRTLEIRPAADFPEVRAHFEKIDPSQIHLTDLSPSGAKAVFSAHGEILTAAAGKGEIRNVTNSPAVAERDPAWSPDGNSIAYLSDESGEYALHIRDQSGLGEVTKINLGNPPNFYYSPTWSPDSRKIGYTDHRLNYWYVDVEKKTPIRIDTDLYISPGHSAQLAWSPDSRWIAYAKQLPSHLHAIFVYSLDQAKSYQLTDGRSDAMHAAFDKNGKYLYFTASTDLASSVVGFDMADMQHPITRNVYVLLLKKATLPPPALEREQLKAKETGDAGEAEDGVRVEIDADGIGQRILALPIPTRNYYDVLAGKPDTLFLVEGPQVEPLQTSDAVVTIVHRFDVSTGKTEEIQNDVAAFPGDLKYVPSFRLSSNGDRMLFAKGNRWFISPTATQPQASDEINLDTAEVYVDPRAEWKHMFEQVWRGERDFFYDPGLHGLNLEAIKKEYQPFLQNIASRSDLTYLFTEMLGNMTSGHMWAWGPDAFAVTRTKTGLLGADYSMEGGRYRFAHIYGADPWNPEIRAPLTLPGASVRAGEYLLAVNGRDVRPTADIYSFFEGTAGKQIVLKVGPQADGTGAREVTVTPVEDETALRNYAWIDDNRRKVDERTNGRVAYVYLPDVWTAGYKAFNRDYFSQAGKDAAIIDARDNGGGLFESYIIDHLREPLWNYWHMREGNDIPAPQEGIFGPKVMLINEITGSGGDGLAWMFRKGGIGPLIGKRTWGGLVGGFTTPGDLMDGGGFATPNLAFYNPEGAWDIENHGVAPDIDVDDDPKAQREGSDSQLERAVAVVLDLLKKNPPSATQQHPPYPNYHRNEQH